MQNITKKETVLHDEHIELCICPIVQWLTELVTLKTILNINKEELTESYRRGSQNRCGVEGFFISCRSKRKELIIAYLHQYLTYQSETPDSDEIANPSLEDRT